MRYNTGRRRRLFIVIQEIFLEKKIITIIKISGILKLDAVDAVDAVDALHPHLLKLDAVHPVPTKTGCSASCIY
jgi:hypothetical protein